jgi:hypothetical protein
MPGIRYAIGALIVVFATIVLVVALAGFPRGGVLAVGFLSILFGTFIYLLVDLQRKLMPGPDIEIAKVIKSEGRRVETAFKAIDRKWNISVNGQSPIVVYTQDDAGRTYESEHLWFSGGDSELYEDPRFLAWQTLQRARADERYSIPVYIDPANPQKYYMDLAELTTSNRHTA